MKFKNNKKIIKETIKNFDLLALKRTGANIFVPENYFQECSKASTYSLFFVDENKVLRFLVLFVDVFSKCCLYILGDCGLTS